MHKLPAPLTRFLRYALAIVLSLVFLPLALPLTLAAYTVVWFYTWTHDRRATRSLLRVLPMDPRRVYKCGRALWSGVADGLGGPTLSIILSYMASKLSRSSRAQDTAVRDIPYGPKARHRLDLFVPVSNKDEKGLAVVVIFPGYRWTRTKRARMFGPMAQTLCGDGVFAVLPRVGTGTNAGLPEMLADFHQAVQWVVANAGNFGGDPQRVHLLGYGAGAHLSALYSLAVPVRAWYAQAGKEAQLLSDNEADKELRQWARAIGKMGRPVAGLILVSGVFDIEMQRKHERERCIENLSATARAFSTPNPEAWSPSAIIRCLRRRSAYIPQELFARNALLIHGRRDSTFVMAQSERMFRELCAVGVPDVNMKIYANLRRVDPAIALLAPQSALAQSLMDDIRTALVSNVTAVSADEEGLVDVKLARANHVP